jgi:hypothetical protein
MTESRRRWDDYVLGSTTERSKSLWNAAAQASMSTLLICGIGFDPRTMDVARQLNSSVGDRVKVLALELPGDPSSPIGALAAANRNELRVLFGERIQFLRPVEVQDASTAGPALTRRLVGEFALLNETHVVVDMSALPSSISFPLIRLLLTQSVAEVVPRFPGDLQVCVSESPSMDARIRPTGLEDPDTLAGFQRLPDNPQTKVWVPVIGEGRGEQLRAAREYLQPDEVCPVLPFPSVGARRSDDLLLEHRLLLFDELQLEPRNVLYASESNPFDLYRQLCDLADRYRRALEPLGGATVVASQHSSKLLSLGVLLAAHEVELVVVHVRPTGYALYEQNPRRLGPEDEIGVPQPVVHTAWLTGQPYVL